MSGLWPFFILSHLRICFIMASPLLYLYPHYMPVFIPVTSIDDVLSENEVFYDPGTNDPISKIDDWKEETSSSIFNGFMSFKKRIYGYPECKCAEKTCNCCTDIKFSKIDFSGTGCAHITILENELIAAVSLKNKTVAQQRQSLQQPFALCIPIPQFPILSVCVRLVQLKRDGANVRGCVNLELQITATSVTIWQLQFTCFKIGLGGVSFSRPPPSTTTPKPNMGSGFEAGNNDTLIRKIIPI